MGLAEDTTTVAIYRQDLDWLKKKQLAVANRNGQWSHMADIVRSVIEAVKAQTEAEEGA